jgi:hypothetical protein
MSWRWTGGVEDHRRVACRDRASRHCRGNRTHVHTFAPPRRGESPQP